MNLIIQTFGAKLRVKDGVFNVISLIDGSTVTRHFAPDLVKSVWLHRSVSVSSDALLLAISHGIEVLIIDKSGMPAGRVMHTKPSSTIKIKKSQVKIAVSQRANHYTSLMIQTKLQNQISFLKKLSAYRPESKSLIDVNVEKIEVLLEKILELSIQQNSEFQEKIRGFEGNAGRIYFKSLSLIIPEPYKFEGRSKHPAVDPFNAILNYSYGILYGHIERLIIKAGLDPYIGFLHRDGHQHKSFVYDCIEPYRVYAEKIAVGIFTTKRFRTEYTEWMDNQCVVTIKGREIIIKDLQDYMAEQKIDYRNRNISRLYKIELELFQLAKNFLNDCGEELDLMMPEMISL